MALEFLEFVRGAEVIIHNAAFDVGFLNHELARLGEAWGRVEDYCQIFDTLKLARDLHPGQRNSLDALCKRYSKVVMPGALTPTGRSTARCSTQSYWQTSIWR